MKFIDKDLVSIQEARIRMEDARKAKEALLSFPQSKLDEILEHMHEGIVVHLEALAVMSVEETGYGCWQDEYAQLKLICDSLMKQLRGMKCVGILKEDTQKKITEVGVPLGIIVALCPSISPVAVAISTAFLCIKTGNALVFAPHIRAKKTVNKVIEILLEEANASGLPEGAITCLETISDEGVKELIKHKSTSLVFNIGIQNMIQAIAHSQKPMIYGGTGPSPAFIERTADIKKAVEDIIISRSFNCGILSGAEQYVVADSLVAKKVKQEMIGLGAYFMTEQEERKLISFLCPKEREMDVEYIGKSASWLAKQARFSVPEGTKVLVSENKYIPDKNPYTKELRCPVIAYYIENDWIHACEKCMELLVNESKGHTLVIHSKDDAVISQFILKKPVARILVNTPAIFGAMGMTTNLFPSMILGGLTQGMGITADNVSPMNLVYIRKAGYEVRTVKELLKFEKLEYEVGINKELPASYKAQYEIEIDEKMPKPHKEGYEVGITREFLKQEKEADFIDEENKKEEIDPTKLLKKILKQLSVETN